MQTLSNSTLQEINPQWIGHFIPDSAIAVASAQLDERLRTTVFYLTSDRISNEAWLNLLARFTQVDDRNLKDYGRLRALSLANREKSLPSQRHFNSRDAAGLLSRSLPHLTLTREEIEQGKKAFLNLGWDGVRPIVLLHVRDSVYKAKREQAWMGQRYAKLMELESSHRDSEINSYVKSVDWLARNGAYVVRTGRSAKAPLPCSSAHILDYANHPSRSDFLDIWLFTQANAVISTGSGPDTAANVFGIPMLEINHLPALAFRSYSRAMSHPKWLLDADTGDVLAPREYLGANYFHRSQYLSKRISIRDLDEREILLAVGEFWQRVTTVSTTTWETQGLQKAYWAVWEECAEEAGVGGFRHPWAQPSTAWLQRVFQGTV